MLSLIFGPGRVDQSGPSSRVGPNTRKGQYSSQQAYPTKIKEDENSELFYIVLVLTISRQRPFPIQEMLLPCKIKDRVLKN
jgi:hypothetical protein